jgi:hypothetical protein
VQALHNRKKVKHPTQSRVTACTRDVSKDTNKLICKRLKVHQCTGGISRSYSDEDCDEDGKCNHATNVKAKQMDVMEAKRLNIAGQV